MLARAGLAALAIALAVALPLPLPARADPDYPAGLFERSPLNGSRAAVSHQRRKSAPSPANDPASVGASGACRHHSEWRYPWPQPC